MKKLFTLIAFFGALFSAFSQDFPIPYNPDDDSNGLIGSPDLLSLLALFGEEFSAAVVSEDNESAVMYTGNLAYPICVQTCKNLPGQWEIASFEDLGLVWDEVKTDNTSEYTWIKKDNYHSTSGVTEPFQYFYSNSTNSINQHRIETTTHPVNEYRCYCHIQEVPRVEYYTCSSSCSDGVEALDACVNDKMADGWYTAGVAQVQQVYSTCHWQTLWRWAD